MTQQTNSKINFALHRNQGKLYLAAAVFFSTLGVNAVAADVWTTCANEGSTCNFSGIKQVRYGANGIYAYKTATGSIGCNNETFGDPVYGVVKQCSIVTSTTSPTPAPIVSPVPAPTTWTNCASEGGSCNFTGTKQVRYGANNSYVYKSLPGPVPCNNTTFGDPAYGIAKQCSLPSATVSPTPVPTPVPPPVVSPTPATNPFANKRFFVDKYSQAALYINSSNNIYPLDIMKKISLQPTSKWFGEWNTNISAETKTYVQLATADGSIPVLTIYNIPNRDCGSYSSGGLSLAAYPEWIKQIALGIGTAKAAVILEPDAVAQVNQAGCLTEQGKTQRYELLKNAITTIKTLAPNAVVYLDAGNPLWIPPSTIAENLKMAGIASADGFALNVSNFVTTEANRNYGIDISARVGNKHFVIDTSRNGLGPTADKQWCNPTGRALGDKPTAFATGLVDAYLWVKSPGESDGTCNSGGTAGTFWPKYAYDLAARAAW